MTYRFEIAYVRFDVVTDFGIDWNPYFRRFLYEGDKDAIYRYTCRVCDALPEPQGMLVYHTDSRFVFVNEQKLEERLLLLPLYQRPLILMREIDAHQRILYINAEYIPLLTRPESFQIFNALAAERMMIRHEGIVLHASYIVYNGEAILFTAPSGTGKSTQGDLWVRYRGAELINGDRVLLKRNNGIWKAYGFPVCGSSDVCLNSSAPIRAVIYLAKGKENRASLYSGSEAIRRVMSETTVNYWNSEFTGIALDLLSDFCSQTPVCAYSCTKEPEAVDDLEAYLEELRK